MPIKIPNELPAAKVLTDENIFIMTETRAITQDIRALKILLLNLMPTKIDTETQLSRLLGNTALQIELELRGGILGRAGGNHGMEQNPCPQHLPYLLGRTGRSVLSLRHQKTHDAG